MALSLTDPFSVETLDPCLSPTYGTSITITGHSFDRAIQVCVGGIPAEVHWVSSDMLVVQTPPLPPGPHVVELKNEDATTLALDHVPLLYTDEDFSSPPNASRADDDEDGDSSATSTNGAAPEGPPPHLTSADPTAFPMRGGRLVLGGTGLRPGVSVVLDGVACEHVRLAWLLGRREGDDIDNALSEQVEIG